MSNIVSFHQYKYRVMNEKYQEARLRSSLWVKSLHEMIKIYGEQATLDWVNANNQIKRRAVQ